jgi:hypothetical protein
MRTRRKRLGGRWSDVLAWFPISAIALAVCGVAGAAGPTVRAIGWQLPSTGLIVGRVVDGPSGRPLTGAIVAVSGPGGPFSPVMVDDRGRFMFRDLPTGRV